MSEITDAVKASLSCLEGKEGRRVLITGGPTCEDIDAVRFITNRSTGRMGVDTALAAQSLSQVPLLIMGPGSAEVAEGIECVRVRSAAQMLEAVEAAFSWCDVLVMTAAVADYTPLDYTDGKLKKSDGELVIRLKRTADILVTLSNHPLRASKKVAGFSLDATMNPAEGRRKLESKNLDLIVVNSVEAFGSGESSVLFLQKSGADEEFTSRDKFETARAILERL